jgi:hypothetical protein
MKIMVDNEEKVVALEIESADWCYVKVETREAGGDVKVTITMPMLDYFTQAKAFFEWYEKTYGNQAVEERVYSGLE